jgi:CBS domain-containing protein
MRVEEVMTKPVASCNPGTNAAVAAEIMWNQNCGSLAVVEDGGRTVGIVTDRDLFIALGTTNRRAADLPVGEVMQTDLSICAPKDTLQTALERMAQRKLHRLPVVDGAGTLLGIVSIDDIVTRGAGDGLSSDDLVRALKAVCERSQQRAARPATA